jgi:hypothetical protein
MSNHVAQALSRLVGGDHPPVRPCVGQAPGSSGPRSPTASIRDLNVSIISLDP